MLGYFFVFFFFFFSRWKIIQSLLHVMGKLKTDSLWDNINNNQVRKYVCKCHTQETTRGGMEWQRDRLARPEFRY
jgi:hypothetical protein